MSDFVSQPTVFREAAAILGESLVYDPAGPGGGAMLWCDISAGLIHRSTLTGSIDGSDDLTFELAPPVASFHPARFGDRPGFVVSLGDRIVLTDGSGVIVRELASVAHAHAGLRLNEGKVDPLGRWVTGSMNMTTGEPNGAFYALDARGAEPHLEVLRGGLGTANGIDWSPDGRTVYFTDTSVETVYRAGYTRNGEIVDDEVFVNDGPHDGLTIDVEGNVWSALYGEGVVKKYDPSGNELLSVELGVPNVTSVAFGGEGLSTLFVTTARENLSETQLEEHPLSGSVFQFESGTRGRLPNTFVSAS